MDAINVQGEVQGSQKIIDSAVIHEPKSRNDSFYSEKPSAKSGVIKSSVNHVIG